MKTIKPTYIMLVLGLLCNVQVFSQAHLAWIPGSTSDNILYDPANGMPAKSDPAWTDIYVNYENSEINLTDGVLNLNTKKGSVYGYELINSAFIPQNTFTLDIKGEMLTDTAAFGVNVNWSAGKNIRLNFLENSIIDAKDNTILKNRESANGMQNYRIVVENDNAALYNGFDFVSALNILSNDSIWDGGFETMTSEEASAYWEHDGYTAISVVTEDKHTGDKSMKWENGWNGRFMGNIKVLPNSTYTLTYWAKLKIESAWGQTKMNGGVYMDGVEIANLPVQGGWAKYTCSFTTSSTTNIVTINYHNGWTSDGSFTIYFDDITLERTATEPYVQVGNLYGNNGSDINIGKVSFLNGNAYRPVILSDLNSLITNANSLYDGATPGNNTGNHPVYAIERFATNISNAQRIAGNTVANPDSIDWAYLDLQKAIDLFNESKITDQSILLQSIEASIETNTLKQNQSAQIDITGKLSNGQNADLSIANIQYKALTPATANTDTKGNVKAIGAGKAEIEVKVELNSVELKDTVKFTVVEYYLSSVEISAYNTKIEVGEASGSSYTATMSDGTVAAPEDITAIYKSLKSDFADVSTSGTIIGKGKGKAEVELSVTVFDKTVKDTLKIDIIALESIEINPAKTTLNSEEESSYTVSAVYSDNSSLTLDKSNSIIWSNNRNVINVNDMGQLKALSAGTATIQLIVKRASSTLKKDVTLEVIPRTDGFEIIEGTECSAYPSPFITSLTINSPKGINRIELFDLSGKSLINETASGEIETTLNLGHLHSGVMILKVTDSNGKSNALKVIKQ